MSNNTNMIVQRPTILARSSKIIKIIVVLTGSRGIRQTSRHSLDWDDKMIIKFLAQQGKSGDWLVTRLCSIGEYLYIGRANSRIHTDQICCEVKASTNLHHQHSATSYADY